MKEALNLTIDRVIPSLGQEAREKIRSICTSHEVQAGTNFVEIGKRDVYEYILLEGISRSYLYDQEGEPVTLLFFQDGDVISPYVTRCREGFSLINIEAITDCSLLKMEAAEFEKLLEQDLDIRNFANTVLRNELLKKTDKEIRLISWTAARRLEAFRKEYDMLENRIPHGMIASFLGITNVSLSRLRKGV